MFNAEDEAFNLCSQGWIWLGFQVSLCKKEIKKMEMRGIDPRTSRMLSERSTIWATSPRRRETITDKNSPWSFLFLFGSYSPLVYESWNVSCPKKVAAATTHRGKCWEECYWNKLLLAVTFCPTEQQLLFHFPCIGATLLIHRLHIQNPLTLLLPNTWRTRKPKLPPPFSLIDLAL